MQAVRPIRTSLRGAWPFPWWLSPPWPPAAPSSTGCSRPIRGRLTTPRMLPCLSVPGTVETYKVPPSSLEHLAQFCNRTSTGYNVLSQTSHSPRTFLLLAGLCYKCKGQVGYLEPKIAFKRVHNVTGQHVRDSSLSTDIKTLLHLTEVVSAKRIKPQVNVLLSIKVRVYVQSIYKWSSWNSPWNHPVHSCCCGDLSLWQPETWICGSMFQDCLILWTTKYTLTLIWGGKCIPSIDMIVHI